MILPLLAEIPFPGWDPVAIRLGPVQMRWYGLSYLAAFIIAGWLLDKLGRDGFVALTKSAVTDLIGWLVVGVMVGGRLGYALFYDRAMFLHPAQLVQVWKGGLSPHHPSQSRFSHGPRCGPNLLRPMISAPILRGQSRTK